ncbi:MAG: AAA family ATPase [Chloroflexaceae bacterium]|nr:AAA family ATPase [Chloroflexaceae bacterium]
MSRDALVVGINRYTDSHLANLTAPAEDAEAIARVLEEYGDFRVGRYPEAIDPETRKPYVGRELNLCLADLEDALIKLFNPQDRAVPDMALFYFSGHGLRRSPGGISEGFLATSDADSTRRFYGLSLQWLRRLLQESPIKQQIVWLDCCYSGELLNVQEADPGEKGQARDRCFIAASRGFEVAYQDISEPYSVLTKELLAGLDPARHPQRWVTNYSLIDHLDRRLGQEATQRPIFSNFGEPINLTRSWEVAVETETKPEVGDPTICPYKGLEFFDNNEEDPKYFFGREELTDKLLDHLRTGNFLALVGASGSGKSSVLRAGLLHQLQQGRKLSGSQHWVIRCFTPGENGQSPLQNLAEAFVGNQLSPVEYAEQLETAEKQLATGADGLRRLVQGLDAPRVVLAIDQFEEIFTLCQDKQEREQFFACLMGALEQLQEKMAVVVTMRADFLGRCVEQDYSGLAQRIQDTVPVTPMSREQLGDAILKPAERVNRKLEPALVEQMLSDVAEAPGTLPLLQYALKQLWQQNPKQLRLEDYIQLGHIGGSLNQRATELFNTMSPTQQAATKRIFLCLTQLGEGTEDTRRRALKRDIITPLHPESVIDEALQVLTNKDNRLIVTSQLQEKGTGSGEVVVDVAHEAVIRHWQLLRNWLSDTPIRDKLREHRQLETAAKEWDRERRKNRRKAGGYLLHGIRLQQANEFRKKEQQTFPLSFTALEFVQKSNRKRQINWVTILGWLGVLLLAAGFLYRQIDINNSWTLVKKVDPSKYDTLHKRALERLNRQKQSF